MNIQYQTQGVCSQLIMLEIEDDKIVSAKFIGCCGGNTSAICCLIKGMPVDEVIEKLQGITCRAKTTSCPDQLAQCLIQYKQKIKQSEQTTQIEQNR